ncbi:MAG: TetR/AcrR family transcriptional regulator [Edaphobacter sp.]
MAKSLGRQPKRTTYRHGDLYRALLTSGIELARSGGPDAVVLREATRRAGVAPNAAYRHFANRQTLVQAVSEAAMSLLATTMEAEQAAVRRSKDPASAARARLRAVGTGYLRFAQAEPGLFQTAFSVPVDLQLASSAASAGESGLTPFQLLSSALDELVEAHVLPPERRMGAEFLAWSAVHGLSMLFIDGPLRSLDSTQKQGIGDLLLGMVERGL